MKNKKLLMTISALMILIYHLWIYIFNGSNIEIFLKQICFIGVDIFFFISAYSIGEKQIEYKKFITNRFKKIYLKFVVFSFIAFLFHNWNIVRLIKVIFGIEFFVKGGGSFLWFIPAIMIVYLLLPLYKKADSKYQLLTPIIFIFIYIIFSILISLFTSYNSIFIFTNRIPIILIGYYYAKYNIFDKLKSNKINCFIIFLLLFIISLFISYKVYRTHFNLSIINDVFYLTAIPLVLSVVHLLNLFTTNKLINFLGSFTLEIYSVQMIFGYKLTDHLYKVTSNAVVTNIFSIFLVIVISLLTNIIFKLIKKLVLLIENKNNQ